MVTRRWVLGAAAAAAAGLRMNCDAKAQENETSKPDASKIDTSMTDASRTVLMTSDDGPGAATSVIIDIAERHQVPFTLFMIGTNVAADPSHRKVLERARASEWISIGNHSFSHCSRHYARCYHDGPSLVSDFERASSELGLTSPVPARGPGRDVWRLPGMQLDDHAISRKETQIEEPTYDALFADGFYLYGWDVEWQHRRGNPRQSARAMVDLLTGSHSRKPGKVVMLMHDVMMRSPKGPGELVRIIEGVRERGGTFGRLSEY
jgi:peptidoglycan/xylan/chitin deacetylase (PgdA/CDA1 family)